MCIFYHKKFHGTIFNEPKKLLTRMKIILFYHLNLEKYTRYKQILFYFKPKVQNSLKLYLNNSIAKQTTNQPSFYLLIYSNQLKSGAKEIGLNRPGH